MMLSFLIGASIAAQKILFPETITVTGWTSIILVVMFFGGLICFLLGIALEYLAGLVLASHGKPLFFVADRRADEFVKPYFIS